VPDLSQTHFAKRFQERYHERFTFQTKTELLRKMKDPTTKTWPKAQKVYGDGKLHTQHVFMFEWNEEKTILVVDDLGHFVSIYPYEPWKKGERQARREAGTWQPPDGSIELL